jgi:hypothetical protein
MASGILSPASPLLPNTAVLIAAIPGLIGIAGIFNPRLPLNAVQFPLPTSPDGLKMADSLMRFFAIRDMFLGASTVAVWYRGDRQLLGIMLLLGAGLAFGDGLVQKNHCGNGEWNHWSFVPVMAGLGAGLEGWFDGFVG